MSVCSCMKLQLLSENFLSKFLFSAVLSKSFSHYKQYSILTAHYCYRLGQCYRSIIIHGT